MKNQFKYFFPLLLIIACSRDTKIGHAPAPIYPKPPIIEVKPDGAYTLNQLTGTSIQPIINSLGDTIKTGISIPVEGKKIFLDGQTQPKSIEVSQQQLIKKNAHPNVYFVPEELTVIPVNEDSLRNIPISRNDSSQYIINSIGDTIPTDIPIRVKGKVMPTRHPIPISALPPRFKDAASTNLQYLDVDQGMASSYIFSILEDRNGNLWFGTNGNGVSRYDGKSFTHFAEEEGLSNNIVWSIIEDRQGNLWFGTNGGGVSKYDGESFTHFTENEGLSNNIVLSIIEDSKDNLWFGTNGGGVCKYDGKSFTHFTENEGLGDNVVRSIIEDREGNLWFGTDGGGVSKYDPSAKLRTGGESFTHFTKKNGLSNNLVVSIIEDSKGNLWFGTYGGGVCKYGPSAQLGTNRRTFTHYTEKEGLSSNYILSISEDRDGNLWFGTKNGVNKYDPSSKLRTGGGSFTHFTEKEGLSNNIVLSIIEDCDGNLWFGSWGGGVSKYNDRSFKHFTEIEGLNSNYVFSTIEDSEGNLWFGTNGGGVSKYDGESFTHFTENEGLSNNVIWSILEDKHGNLWFGTNGEGVCKYDGKSFTHFTKKEGLSGNIVRSIIEDRDGNLWFGTYGGGVSKYDPSAKLRTGGESFTHFTEKEGLSSNFVRSIIEDKQGNLWFGTNGGGVCKYDPSAKPGTAGGGSFTHFTEREGLSNNVVLSIIEDNEGNLWFGTNGGGVNRYDGKTFMHYTEKEGLSSNIIWSMVKDGKGNLWLGTESGLSKLIFGQTDFSIIDTNENRKSEDITIHNFNKNDGLKGLDFYANSVCLDSKNRIWWGSGKSLTMLDMNKFTLPQEPPVVSLRQLYINEQFIDYRNISDNLDSEIDFNGVQHFENYPLNLELPSNKNHLTFHFSATDCSSPNKTQYSYIMEGLNSNWSQPNIEAKADYRNLSYGTYIFKVRATNESGIWSEAFEYEFTIHAPWWHTWYARVGYSAIAVLLILCVFRLHTANLKKRQQELVMEVSNATQKLKEQKKEVEKQKDIIEEAHLKITDSIRYAKRIQSAILPSEELVRKYLPKSFILYKPKDIVAGDFYWLKYKENQVLFAACDCTGHGVPGAMVSVVCNNGLNRSVREYGLTDPGKILDMTREIVIAEFEKSKEEVQDGMDVALCSLEGYTLKYAGANNPLWIIRDGALIETKANNQPIGKFENPQLFKTHIFELKKGDTVYIFSDGYVDQFGGGNGKKYMSKAFRELLLSIQDKAMDEQGIILDKVFEDWKGSLEQIDDVCVIGVKV